MRAQDADFVALLLGNRFDMATILCSTSFVPMLLPSMNLIESHCTDLLQFLFEYVT